MEQKITAIQPRLTKHFAHLIATDHLSHAYLLSGPAGTDKFPLALWIAQGIFCNHRNLDGSPCLKCSTCRRIADNDYPDVVHIEPEGRTIKVGQIRFLKSEFSKSGLEGSHKVFIIRDAEKMTTNAANSLLKFIEEPNGNSNAFLLSSHISQILPTIVSRCQIVEMATLDHYRKLEEIQSSGISLDVARVLVNLNENLDTLKKLGQDERFQNLISEVTNWMQAVLNNDLRAFVFVQTRLIPLIDGQQAQTRLLDLILMICRDLILLKYGSDEEVTFVQKRKMLQQAVTYLSATQLTNGIELVLDCWNQLAVNVSFQNILEELTLKLCQCYHRR